jgi:hypothetical protein
VQPRGRTRGEGGPVSGIARSGCIVDAGDTTQDHGKGKEGARTTLFGPLLCAGTRRGPAAVHDVYDRVARFSTMCSEGDVFVLVMRRKRGPSVPHTEWGTGSGGGGFNTVHTVYARSAHLLHGIPCREEPRYGHTRRNTRGYPCFPDTVCRKKGGRGTRPRGRSNYQRGKPA